jgi:hypothetical protein
MPDCQEVFLLVGNLIFLEYLFKGFHQWRIVILFGL